VQVARHEGGLVLVDGHAHIWLVRPELYPWQPTFGYVPDTDAPVELLLSAMDRAGVAHAILVQPSAYGPDHRLLLETVRAYSQRFLAIGLARPEDPMAGQEAERLVRDDGCVGLRVNLSLDAAQANAQAEGSFWDALETLGVPVCVRATPAHRELLATLVARYPHIRVVIDHLGLPDRNDLVGAAAWLELMAAHPNCYLKVAGLARLSVMGPPHRDLWSLLRMSMQWFGADRMLWGSDFPAVATPDRYLAEAEGVMSLPFIRSPERELLLSGTSRSLWGSPLPVAR
jgi:L-fuconolactonase